MKPLMMRWKIVPSYSGSVVFARVAGWVHSRRPSARSAKLATVLGAWSGNRSTVMSPWLVCSTARRAGEVDSVTPPLSHPGLDRAVGEGRRPAGCGGVAGAGGGPRGGAPQGGGPARGGSPPGGGGGGPGGGGGGGGGEKV